MLRSTICNNSGGRVFSLPRLAVCLSTVFVLLLAGSLWVGYEIGWKAAHRDQAGETVASSLRNLLEDQQRQLEDDRQHTRAHLDALALRLGVMQSHIMRLDALGEKLVKIGELDAEEFNFDEDPARGGVESFVDTSSLEFSDLVSEMEQLSIAIEDREHKLRLMQDLIRDSQIQQEFKPAGRPVIKGWISSNYGYRKDPFTGKRAFHRGVDIAGKKDSEVFAVASGVVSWAGKKSGYGYLVEIRHPDGYVTRYGHNSMIFVKTGDLVDKGTVIGLMGSSGRSTGPHVHFEISRNGKSINPKKYLN